MIALKLKKTMSLDDGRMLGFKILMEVSFLSKAAKTMEKEFPKRKPSNMEPSAAHTRARIATAVKKNFRSIIIYSETCFLIFCQD